MDFREDQFRRYARHILLPQVGGAGQERLLNARVLVVGSGGLGSPVTLYLAAAGVGHLGVVDDDRVDLSNLQRQVLFDTASVDAPKAAAAAERLKALNPDVSVDPLAVRLDDATADRLVPAHDVVVDCTDNFATRYALNAACVRSGRPLVTAALMRFDGQVTTIRPGQGPCYRCLFPDPPDPGTVPSCAQAGVFGALAGLLGSVQAMEVLKLLLGIGDPLVGRLLLVDALGMSFDAVTVARDPDCADCGGKASGRARHA